MMPFSFAYSSASCARADASVNARHSRRAGGRQHTHLAIHFSPRLQIALVPCQSNDHVGVAASLQLLHPALGAAERVLQQEIQRRTSAPRVCLVPRVHRRATAHSVRDIKHDDGCRRTAVVHGRQAAVALWVGGKTQQQHVRRAVAPRRGRHPAAPCPAVSQISNLTVVSSTCTVCVKNAAAHAE